MPGWRRHMIRSIRTYIQMFWSALTCRLTGMMLRHDGASGISGSSSAYILRIAYVTFVARDSNLKFMQMRQRDLFRWSTKTIFKLGKESHYLHSPRHRNVETKYPNQMDDIPKNRLFLSISKFARTPSLLPARYHLFSRNYLIVPNWLEYSNGEGLFCNVMAIWFRETNRSPGVDNDNQLQRNI